MIVVVGAGPAGLAIAYELQQRGYEYSVLERHTVGYAWLNHYDRLHLHTLKQVSALPGLPMPRDYPNFPSAHQVHAYLETYARHFGLHIRSGVDVQHATWSDADGMWKLETNQGHIEAHTLIAATGIWSCPYRAEFPGQEQCAGTIIHASEYRNAAPFAGQRVLVVGAGNSGTEIAVDLCEHGVTTALSIRSGVTFAPHPTSAAMVRGLAWLMRTAPRPLGEWLLQRVRRDFTHVGIYPPATRLIDTYPVIGYTLPEAVEAGKVTVYKGIQRFLTDGVQFEDGLQVPFDSVILSTGYRPALQWVAHEVELDGQGRPRVDRQWRSLRNPHLFCAGYWYPATAGWLQSIGRVAQQVGLGVKQA